MATRKTTRTVTPAVPTPSPAAAKPRRAEAPKPPRTAAPRRATRPAPDAPASVTAAAVTEEDIRLHAYFLSLERRGPATNPRADWLRAERELAAGRETAALPQAGQ